jgi:hypothetical protein
MAITTFTLLAKQNRTNFSGSRNVTIPATITRVNSIRIYVDSTTNAGAHTFTDSVNMHLSFQAANSLTGPDFGFDADGGAVDHQGNPVDPEVTAFYDSTNRPSVGSVETLSIAQSGTFRLGVFADVDHD